MTLILIAAVGLLLSLAPPAHAQSETQAPRSFEELHKRGDLVYGMTVVVRDATGRETKGILDTLERDSLSLVAGNQRRTFAESDVSRIRTAGGKATGIGIVIGVAAGLGISAAGAAVYGRNESGTFCAACFALVSAITVPAGAAIGGGIGAMVNRTNRRTLYLAPGQTTSLTIAPTLGSRGAGLQASFTF